MDSLQNQDRFFCMNIRNCLKSGEQDLIGGDELQEILSDFSSPKNKDVEMFLKERAVEFTKKQQSVTYLVFSNETLDLAGYFSIAMKPVVIKAEGLSNAVKRRLDRLSKYDKENGTYTVAAYLIAQFGRNYSSNVTCPINGTELMDYAISRLREIQFQLGGLMVYLECEEKEALLHFYEDKKGFRQFGERMTDQAAEPHKLLQLMNFL